MVIWLEWWEKLKSNKHILSESIVNKKKKTGDLSVSINDSLCPTSGPSWYSQWSSGKLRIWFGCYKLSGKDTGNFSFFPEELCTYILGPQRQPVYQCITFSFLEECPSGVGGLWATAFSWSCQPSSPWGRMLPRGAFPCSSFPFSALFCGQGGNWLSCLESCACDGEYRQAEGFILFGTVTGILKDIWQLCSKATWHVTSATNVIKFRLLCGGW